MKGFSIIICCYNSEKVIEETLIAISQQNFDAEQIEVILVNNNCTDNTVFIAQDIWKNLYTPFELRIIDEPTPGLSYARKAGVFNAKFSYVIFCDDDNFLEKNYLSLAFNTFEKELQIGAIGGQGIPKSNIVFPKWFDNYKHAYACGKQDTKSGYVTYTKGSLYGAALCLRKHLITKIFQELNSNLTDRKAEFLTSGGDSELCFHVVLNGYELFYNENMIFYHFIEEGRLNMNYLHKLYHGFGKAHFHLYPLEKTVLGKNKNEKIPFIYLCKLWKRQGRGVFQYLIKGSKYSGTVRGAWLWGLTCEYFKN
jgi:glycosyltransferase involved in cell wall biosynthesis